MRLRFTQGDLTALPAAARQLVQDGVDIIFVDHDDGARAAQQATTQIPIVGVAVGDPLGRGLVQASPGLVAISLGWRISTLSWAPNVWKSSGSSSQGSEEVLFLYHATEAYATADTGGARRDGTASGLRWWSGRYTPRRRRRRPSPQSSRARSMASWYRGVAL